jgi:hypothetical protein
LKTKTKKIYYISTRDVRKNRADAVHIMLSCQAFSLLDIDVELVTPFVLRDEYVVEENSIFQLYNIDNPKFTVTELGTKISEVSSEKTKPYRIILEKLKAFWSFGFSNRKNLRSADTIIYSKCYISTLPFIILKKIGFIKSLIVFEAITPKDSLLHRIIYKNSDKIISHLKFVTDDILKFSKTDKKKIFEPPYFTQSKELAQIKANKQELREELKLDENDTYVLYAGKTGEKIKQVQYFIDAAHKTPQLKFLIVGANNNAIKAFEKIKLEREIDNLLIFSFLPLTEYYKFVLASDILIGYYPATHHHKYHLSPGKSGIYFASKNPCIFSDLPSLRWLFPDDIVFYAKPDNVDVLVSTILEVENNKETATKRAELAFEFASKSTYNRFAESIINFIDS